MHGASSPFGASRRKRPCHTDIGWTPSSGWRGRSGGQIKALDWLLEKVIEDHHDTTDR